MAGFLSSLFGGTPKTADPDPVPGIGGYDIPRGPTGETGYPGSTSATRINPRTAWKNIRRGTPYVPIGTQQEDRQNQPGEWHGGVPFSGTLSATGVGPQYQDTEKRSDPTISANIPGGLRQRNTVYYGGVQARPTPEKRYVYGGTNGGFESHSVERRMPYTGHGAAPGSRSLRGAVLDGNRFGQAPPILQPQGDGYGVSRRRGSGHKRPTIFTEPAPWAAQFYDTTAATGGPDTPGTPKTVVNVHVSPQAARRTSSEAGRMTPAESQQRYYRANREKVAARLQVSNRAMRAALKADVLGHYGGVCACCGEDQMPFLTLDHIDGGGEAHRKSLQSANGRNGGEKVYRELRRQGYPAGYQVLCWNCNSGRHINGGVCPHEERALRLVSGGG